MNDSARAVLADPRAPADERYDATIDLQKSVTVGASPEWSQIIDQIGNDYAEQEFLKSISSSNVVQFPSKQAQQKREGMQSVYLDDMQISWQGGYFQKQGGIDYNMLRSMADGTPLIASIIMTRVRQVARFCAPQEAGEGPGFTIRHIEKDHALTDSERESCNLLTKFFQNCGWEFNPRRRRKLKRDDFASFMSKSVRDTLILDNTPIETEMKRERELGIDGFYQVDGASVYLVNELEYSGDDEIFACQVVNGTIRAAYGYDDLILVPRNPSSSILTAGYGTSELEYLIKIVTGFLNALEINLSGMSKNSIPRGFMTLVGKYSATDLAAFKRYWTSTVRGVNNRFNMPVMVSEDMESKAEFVEIGNQVDEVMYSKWMELLGAIACAVYSIAPEEINWTSYSASKSSLSGNDTTEKMAQSMDKGLRPLLSYYQNLFTDYIVSDFSDKYCFRFAGLDEEDEQQRFEARKISQTWNEFRAAEGLDAIDGDEGEMPMNPSFIGPWMQIKGIGQQQEQAPEGGGEDFGDPGQNEGDEAQGNSGGNNGGEQGGPEQGAQGNAAPGGEDEAQGVPAQDGGEPTPKPDFGKDSGKDFGKSFGLPVMTVWGSNG